MANKTINIVSNTTTIGQYALPIIPIAISNVIINTATDIKISVKTKILEHNPVFIITFSFLYILRYHNNVAHLNDNYTNQLSA